MSTPPPSLSLIDHDEPSFHSDHVVTEELSSIPSGFPSAATKSPESRPRPIVRLPPSRPTHASKQVSQQDSSSTGGPYSDPLANSNPAWQDFFKTLMANRDSTVTKPSESTMAVPTIIDLANESNQDDAPSSGTTENQEPDTAANRTGKKKRRRHRAGKGKGKRKANPESEIEGEVLEPASLKASAPTVNPSSTALLLQNASENWVNVCRLLMGEVSPDDREILNQIEDLISRLEQAMAGATHPPSKEEHLMTVQETEDERKARLERIGSRLLWRRKEQPVEHRLVSQDTVTLASRSSVRVQEDESSHERTNGCTEAGSGKDGDEESLPEG
ncbi:MAG: hypothetical protein Q9208_006361 [Pyrenodesmia sp. 3 TL-2023]